MSPDHCLALARYNRWMNEKLYAVAATLTDEERKRDRAAFFKSIQGTFNHLLVADRVWMGRFTGVSLHGDWMGPGGIRALDQELYADFDELRRERAKMDAEIEEWVAILTAEKLAAPLRYTRKGMDYADPLWWSVAHLFNHQTHHRGQVTTLLRQAGPDPGVTDLIAMFWQEAVAAKAAVTEDPALRDPFDSLLRIGFGEQLMNAVVRGVAGYDQSDRRDMKDGRIVRVGVPDFDHDEILSFELDDIAGKLFSDHRARGPTWQGRVAPLATHRRPDSGLYRDVLPHCDREESHEIAA